jgi:hypothetical protein
MPTDGKLEDEQDSEEIKNEMAQIRDVSQIRQLQYQKNAVASLMAEKNRAKRAFHFFGHVQIVLQN